MRSYSDEVREKTIDEIKKIVKGLSIAAGLPENKMPKVLLKDEYTPALYNDPEFSRKVLSFISKKLVMKMLVKYQLLWVEKILLDTEDKIQKYQVYCFG